jgi:serine kinase of HPr protein (carbohydrate metabolism regulator)
MGGHFALRGSAVLANGEALVITGNSGVGKSALAAALTRSGASVLADGYVFVDAVPHQRFG